VKSYIISWILVAILSALAEFLIPGGRGGKLTGYVRYVAGLCILISLVPTISEGVGYIRDLSTDVSMNLIFDEAYADHHLHFMSYLSEVTQEEYETWLLNTLEEQFGITREDCEITVTMDQEGEVPMLASVGIGLSGKALLVDPHRIEGYVREKLSVACTVYAM